MRHRHPTGFLPGRLVFCVDWQVSHGDRWSGHNAAATSPRYRKIPPMLLPEPFGMHRTGSESRSSNRDPSGMGQRQEPVLPFGIDLPDLETALYHNGHVFWFRLSGCQTQVAQTESWLHPVKCLDVRLLRNYWLQNIQGRSSRRAGVVKNQFAEKLDDCGMKNNNALHSRNRKYLRTGNAAARG